MKLSVALLLGPLLASLLASSALAQQVALTFDDLPSHGQMPHAMSRAGIAKAILRILTDAKAPKVYGFVNGEKLRAEPVAMEVLKLWTAAGYPLGNHTFTHMNLDENTVEAFEKDIEANEPLLSSLLPAGRWRWFRYPYLFEGDTLEKRRQVKAFLQAKNYRIAEVTLNFDDYAWNAPYARCLDKSDIRAIEGLQASYLKNAAEGIRVGQEMSKTLFGRDIRYVMLLHIGGFETVMLPKLLDLLRQRGFALVTLDDAESDPAYRIDPDVALLGGPTLLEAMMSTKHLQYPAREKSPLPELDSVCK